MLYSLKNYKSSLRCEHLGCLQSNKFNSDSVIIIIIIIIEITITYKKSGMS